MKTATANMHFPVLGFTPDREIWGFQDLDTLTSCGPRTLKDDMQVGMELVDSDGRRWVVRSIRRLGRDRPLLRWLASTLLTGVPGSRIEQELDELSPLSLPEIKERACGSVEATSMDYCADDEREEVLVPLLAQVRAAESVARIHELLGLDSFMGY
jgi:hypothetical protein